MEDNEIHVWQVDLADPRWDDLGHSLSLDEHQRYSRVVIESTRAEWRRSRIALRMVLSQYIGLPPVEIKFCVGMTGKPGLSPEQGVLEFNVSHSESRALIAVASCSLGVDIERLASRGRTYTGLLASICDPTEALHFRVGRSSDQCEDFIRLWTRKEAYCKATGLGLYKAMDSFRVVECSSSGDRVVLDPGAPGIVWHLHDLPCDPGWMACICTKQDKPNIQLYKLTAM